MNLCPVCNEKDQVEVQYVCTVDPYKGKQIVGYRCGRCGLHRFPNNVGEYKKVLEKEGYERFLRDARNANESRPGREFYMAEMGIEILGKPDSQITFFGSGLNTDWKWVSNKYQNATTKLVDMENMQDAKNFESINDATVSDIVVASEVVEHFSEPLLHFQSLLRLIGAGGLVICSTNVYDGSDISRHNYPFVPGHIAYWSPLALITVAASCGCYIDFRTPTVAFTRAGPRKKYLLFYRSTDILYRISNYFGVRSAAPSES